MQDAKRWLMNAQEEDYKKKSANIDPHQDKMLLYCETINLLVSLLNNLFK